MASNQPRTLVATGFESRLQASESSKKEPTASPQELAIQLYDRVQDLEGLRPDWEGLLATFRSGTTFSTWEWLAPWWEAFGGQKKLRVLAARDGSSLVGLACFSLTTERIFGSNMRVLRLMGDGSHDSDNLDLPVHPDYATAFGQAVFNWLEHSNEWDICQLRTMPGVSLVGNGLLGILKARAWKVYLSTRPQSVIPLPESWKAYLKGLSSKERGKIGIRTRRLEKKYQVLIRKCAAESELDAALEALYQLHRKHWELRGLPGTLHVSERRQFYRNLAAALLARKRLEFWLLEADNKIVAAQFGFRHADTVFSLQEGFDPAFSSDSVGYVLRGQVLKNLIADGVRKYDFLGGTDESKLRWGAEVKRYINLEFARPRTRGRVCLLLRDTSARTKKWLRTRLPDPLWRVSKFLAGRKPRP